MSFCPPGVRRISSGPSTATETGASGSSSKKPAVTTTSSSRPAAASRSSNSTNVGRLPWTTTSARTRVS